MPNWEEVSSRVPHLSVLGPLLFNRFINDMEEGRTHFADDTKMGEVA